MSVRVSLRSRPKGARVAPFGLIVSVLIAAPGSVGHLDSSAALTSETALPRWRLSASPFGSAQAATFNFPRPVGTAIPELTALQRVRLDFRSPAEAIEPAPPPEEFPKAVADAPSPAYPSINRRLKGDLLARARPEVPREAAPRRVKSVALSPFEPTPQETIVPVVQEPSVLPTVTAALSQATPSNFDIGEAAGDGAIPGDTMPMAPFDPADADEAAEAGHQFTQMFETPVSATGPIQEWPAEEVAAGPAADTKTALAVDPGAAASLAPKGEAPRRSKTPAERLGLSDKARAKAEKCLAHAVYFEARSEPFRGQIAVAQVVMNRVFSGFYPDDVCATVYQGSHRHLSCQFTFTCDGIRDVVTEPKLYGQAQQIARDTLDGKVWLPEIGKSTHYHASYVHPWWARSMRKLSKIGLHKFYRPKNWGDGADAPAWGPGFSPDAVSAKL